jgi:hypothetical protein
MKNLFATHKPVSILSNPKPWSGIALQSQENSVKSWLALHQHERCRCFGLILYSRSAEYINNKDKHYYAYYFNVLWHTDLDVLL